MKFPKRIQPLIEDGLVDEVISQLMSGKEATVYVVRCGIIGVRVTLNINIDIQKYNKVESLNA
jgi:serine/threonine-protein kinase RIO1